MEVVRGNLSEKKSGDTGARSRLLFPFHWRCNVKQQRCDTPAAKIQEMEGTEGEGNDNVV